MARLWRLRRFWAGPGNFDRRRASEEKRFVDTPKGAIRIANRSLSIHLVLIHYP